MKVWLKVAMEVSSPDGTQLDRTKVALAVDEAISQALRDREDNGFGYDDYSMHFDYARVVQIDGDT